MGNDRNRSRSGVLALAFAVAFLVLFLAPPFLPYRFDLYPLINWADVVDLVTPLVLVPLYWLLLSDVPAPLARGWMIAFLILAAAWVDAHGIHLTANAIGHLIKQPGQVQQLTEFSDERFGHYYWHAAVLGLSALILVRQALTPASVGRPTGAALAAAALYGFALFLIGDEGGTAPLMVPFAAIVTVAAWPLRKRLLSSPVAVMFVLGSTLALILFAIWFVYWGGRLPQFSEVGWIK
jgi:hypothetical protein